MACWVENFDQILTWAESSRRFSVGDWRLTSGRKWWDEVKRHRRLLSAGGPVVPCAVWGGRLSVTMLLRGELGAEGESKKRRAAVPRGRKHKYFIFECLVAAGDCCAPALQNREGDSWTKVR